MTESEKQEIVNRVLSSLSTNSATIDQLIETGACTDNDYFETGKGNKVSYANMMKPIHQKYDRKFSDLNKDIAKKTTELNISVLYPTQGAGGTNKYDLSTAIVQVPEELRKAGLVVSFLNQQGKVEKWTYQGGTWAAASFVQQASGGNKILEWNTDVATTRKQVPASERKAGMQISYLHPEKGWVNEQYIGTAVSDTEFIKDENWVQITNQQQLFAIESNLSRYFPATDSVLTSIITGKFLRKDGMLTSISNGVTSDFIPYNERMNLKYSGRYGANAVGIVFYNPLFDIIGYQFENTSSVTVYNETIAPPENTAYLRGCSLDKNNFEIRNINITDTAEELKKDISQNTSDIDNNAFAISELEKKYQRLKNHLSFHKSKKV